MADINKKMTIKEMCDIWCDDYDPEKFSVVRYTVDGVWRHGTTQELIVHRVADNTYWSVGYRTDKDGDYNEFRDGELTDRDVRQVVPVEVKKIEYREVR